MTNGGDSYAFCETSFATGSSPLHIRRLTSKGYKFSGGADTKSLCGRKVAWDITRRVRPTDIKPSEVGHYCPACADAYQKAIA